MSRIRVLIVDDAVVIRRIVSDVLAGDPELEVVGTAASGKIALAKIPQINPDLITLDVEMPEMNGIETLREIRKIYPKLPVIMFSTLTSYGAAATLDALSAGASDYVTKPANVGSVAAAMAKIREELIPKIKGLCIPPHAAPMPKTTTGARTISMSATPVLAKPPAVRIPINVVAIGVSTGGPSALAEVIPMLPNDLDVPILITQHMPPVFTRLLAERLNSKSTIGVREGEEGMTLEPNVAYMAPGDFHMTVRRQGTHEVISLNQNVPENSCRPAVDVMFRSAVGLFGASALGVIMTGMGQDGLRGCELIKAAGGSIVVQDEQSSVVWGMPGYVARAGLAEAIAPLHQIAGQIIRRVNAHRTTQRITV